MIFTLLPGRYAMMRLSIVVLSSFFSLSLYALEDLDQLEIQQRIEPVGKVHIQDQNDAATNSGVEKASSEPEVKKEPGEETYEQYCHVCHKDGLAGAPKFRDKNDWSPRLEGKNIDDLVAIAIKGLNAMPAKGTCTDCSDADLKDAIQYMLPKS